MRPLAVRVDTGAADRVITRRVSDLTWTKTAPGGWASGTLRISVGYDDLPIPALSYIEVTDARTGRVVMCGYADQPGRGYDGAQGYDVSFAGPTSVLEDQRRSLYYISSDLGDWQPDSGSSSNRLVGTDGSSSTVPGEDSREALVMSFPQAAIGSGKFVGMLNAALRDSDMALGAYSYQTKSGLSSSDWQLQAQALPSAAQVDRNASTTYGGISSTFATFGSTQRTAWVGFRRTGSATNVGSDSAWGAFADVMVKGLALAADGSVQGANTTPYMTPGFIVADLIGRMCPLIDGTTASISASPAQVTQLVYAEPTTAAQVLDDLALYEPDAFHYVTDRSAAGRHQFAYRAWQPLTSPRYEISQRDGLEITGREGGDLANRIVVTWTEDGKTKSTTRTRTVPELGSRIRDAEPIALPDGQGSLANAQRIGDAILAQMADQGVSGRAVVARPIRDLHTGALLMPWEIEAGEIAVVVETGQTARVTEVAFDGSDGASAALSLGQPTRSLDQLVAAGLKKRR